jgi:hypothetical protein
MVWGMVSTQNGDRRLPANDATSGSASGPTPLTIDSAMTGF